MKIFEEECGTTKEQNISKKYRVFLEVYKKVRPLQFIYLSYVLRR